MRAGNVDLRTDPTRQPVLEAVLVLPPGALAGERVSGEIVAFPFLDFRSSWISAR